MITSNKITMASALAYLGRKPEWRLIIPDEKKKITEALESAINSGGHALVKLSQEWYTEVEEWRKPIAEMIQQAEAKPEWIIPPKDYQRGETAVLFNSICGVANAVHLKRTKETGVSHLVIEVKEYLVKGWLCWASHEEARAIRYKVRKMQERLRKGESILGAVRKLGYTPDDLAWYFGEGY